MSESKARITSAQARTLALWLGRVGTRPATVYEVFGARNNQNNGHRRNCEALIRSGALILHGGNIVSGIRYCVSAEAGNYAMMIANAIDALDVQP